MRSRSSVAPTGIQCTSKLSLNRTVAVKMILSGAFANDEFIQRFRAEAEAAAGLQHPNIVAIHEVGQCDGRRR